MDQEPFWVTLDSTLAIHDMNIMRFGGLEGIRDMNLLQSALARPQNLYAYEDTDLFRLASAYGYGISRNHPFLDANKRTAYVVTRLFLRLNAFRVKATPEDSITTMLKLAKGDLDESAFAAWLKDHCVAA